MCAAHREVIARYLAHGVRLTRVGKLLRRQGVAIGYATLRRFALAELGFGGTAPTVPVADCAPGAEVQIDTGWMTLLERDLFGQRRRFRAWIFTAVRSRHRFVYPVFRETTATAIEACEAAWAFFGGVFRAAIVDNTKGLVERADPVKPKLVPGFLEYAQARGFAIDPTRVRRPTDRDHGALDPDAEGGMSLPARLRDARGGAAGDWRVHRAVQPGVAARAARLPDARRRPASADAPGGVIKPPTCPRNRDRYSCC